MCSPTVTSSGMPSSTAASAASADSSTRVHVMSRGLEPRDPRRVDEVGIQGEVELHVPAPAATASATSRRSIATAASTNSSTPSYAPSTVVKGWAKIDAAGNVTLNGVVEATSRP